MGKNKNKVLCILPGDPALEPGLGKGSVGKRLVAGPVPMGSGRAQPKKETCVHPHVAPPPIKLQPKAWLRVLAVRSPVVETGNWDMECYLCWGRNLSLCKRFRDTG